MPTRGLRQGDPLSPFLFLICSEGLSSLLAHEEDIGGIEGVQVCRNEPSISHLLFADDSLILMKANISNARTLKKVLETYCQSSGQMVSNAKSSIYFSPNTGVSVRYRDSDGEMRRTERKCTGSRGGRCVLRRRKGAWDFETFIVSTLLC